MHASLVIMAAGIGSRYGGNKQTDGVGPHGEILMEYGVYDAVRAGFDKVVFIIKPDMRELMERLCGRMAAGLRTADGENVQSTLYMGILLALALVLPLTTIFLFKRRMLQFRLGVVEMILLLGAQIVMGIYYFLSYRLFSSFEFHAQSVKLPLVLPLIAMIFTYLAVRAIFRDELMIRSMDRIR